jgi:hypothetical protein
MSMEELEAKKYTATARATIVLEVTDLGGWGGTCSVAQIAKQASEDAAGRIGNFLATAKGRGIRMIGEPVVTAVFTKVAE